MTDSRVLPFPVTLAKLSRRLRLAQLQGDAEQARDLLAQLNDRRLRVRYEQMADPQGHFFDDDD